jgi:hypothetical protein
LQMLALILNTVIYAFPLKLHLLLYAAECRQNSNNTRHEMNLGN